MFLFVSLLVLAPLPCTTKLLDGGKIKHIIVLMEENRSFDHMFGFSNLPVEKLKGNEYNLVNTSNPLGPRVTVSDQATYVNSCDPAHSTPSTRLKIGAGGMTGFVDFENQRGRSNKNYCDVMSGFTPEKVPIITTLAEEFALMDRFFCSHAGPTWPNRMYALSATSMGSTETSTWFQDVPGQMFPQKTIFDQMEDNGLVWRNYYNDTPWELFVEKMAHSPNNLRPLTEFFADAARGTLPSYAWINPRAAMNATTGHGSNDQHPDHDVALGEALIKDIYEALRASPQWNETLFIITYDEHGGFFDHVTPPHGPSPDDATSYPDRGYVFDTLGVRVPTLLISPWIPKGTVVSSPPKAQKPAEDSQYDLTSIMATARKILGMTSGPLTKRDAWAATFEHVLDTRDTPRADCPLHLPAAPPPAKLDSEMPEGDLAPNDLQRDIVGVHAHLAGVQVPELRRQRDLAKWMQEAYSMHADKTTRWVRSKTANKNWTVSCRPGKTPGWLDTFKVNCGGKGTSTSSPCTSSFQTISTNTLKDEHGTHYCLTWSNTSSTLHASLCYPSPDPASNRDSSQWWEVVTMDATVHPHGRPDLCLTNSKFDGKNDTFLEYTTALLPCDGRIQQHWGYGGNGKWLVYGSCAVIGLI